MIMPGSAATSQTTVAAGLQIGLGTRPSASEIVQTQGDFAATGNPLDLTVEGLGFFQVHLPNGDTAYTRSGAFHLDAQGNVVTAEGDPIEPPITIPSGVSSISIGADGTVSVRQPGQQAAQQVGSIQLALFPNPGGLNSVGKNLFLATTASGDPIVGTPGGTEGLGTVQQGMLEQANVNVVEEFIQVGICFTQVATTCCVVRQNWMRATTRCRHSLSQADTPLHSNDYGAALLRSELTGSARV